MITLYSYPKLFGVADNNAYGLKVFAFLKLTDVPFVHQHIFDASGAPRGQLPYVLDKDEAIGDSDTIIAHVIYRYGLTVDDGLTDTQRDTGHLIGRMLDDLYWVMSYSRWKDEQFWPAFRNALRREHPSFTDPALDKAREFYTQRYYYQGIGRFSPTAVPTNRAPSNSFNGTSFNTPELERKPLAPPTHEARCYTAKKFSPVGMTAPRGTLYAPRYPDARSHGSRALSFRKSEVPMSEATR